MLKTSAKVLLDGLWPAAPTGLNISLVVTDSRMVQPGCVFVAIKGERVDGHDFAKGAIENGAALIIIEKPVEGVSGEHAVLVESSLDAIIAMGANYRKMFNPLILGITGSVGKTTTKEFCGAVFSSFGETLKTFGNQNTEIGMPNTLFRMDESTRYAVLEMGMQQLGEIRKLAVAAKPHCAIITKIGTTHIETLGSVENILHAKMEICDGLVQGAPLILNGDDEMLRKAVIPAWVHPVFVGIENSENEVSAKNIERDGGGQIFKIKDAQFGEFSAFIPALGRHNITNALLAYTAATRLGLNAAQSAAALAGFETAGMRQNVVDYNGITVIEDCYNAAPDSMKAALSILGEIETQGKRIAVLGDMLEMGEMAQEVHTVLAQECADANVNLLITVGNDTSHTAEEAKKLNIKQQHFTKNIDAANFLNENAKKGDCVLVKASRGMRFEEILEEFAKDKELVVL